jgi:serine/threonine protein kinase
MTNESDTLRERLTDFRWSVFDDVQILPSSSANGLSDPFRPGQQIPGTPWVIVRLLGQGGVGRVFEVEHELLGRKAAFKVLHPQNLLRRGLAERMTNEGRLLGSIRHANIVDAIDMGVLADGSPYLVLELLEGRDLRAEQQRLGMLSIPAALDIASQVLRGLSVLHDANIVHRDIKLENIFLCADGHVEILDLGAAAQMGESAGEGTPSLGTPRTMAPEQYEGKPVDGRTDLYALGIVLYELLTGRGPFDDVSGIEALRFAHCHRPPAAPSQVAPQFIPPQIDAFILRVLAKSARDRFVSADEMAKEVAALRAASLPTSIPVHSNRPTDASVTRAVSVTMPSSWAVQPAWSGFRMAIQKPFFSPMWLASIAVLALLMAALALGVAVGRRIPLVDVAVRYVA